MSSKIKVAHLVLSLELGGLETLVVNFLSSINRDKFEITVGSLECPGALAGEIEKLDMPLTSFGRREGIDLRMIPRIAKWLRRERPDILHTHNAAAHFYGSLGGKAAGIRCVVHTKHGRDWPDKPRKVLLNRISSFFTTKIVTVSKNAYEVASRIEKVPKTKLTIIHNGIDTERYKPGDGDQVSFPIAGVPPGAFVIGTVARLSPEKDQKTLISAFAELCDLGKDIFLVIAGDGPSREELQGYASKLPCGNRIRFLGAVKNIPDLLRSFKVFALTSRTEGISLAILEAAAAGVPAVVTDVGGNSEVVVDGVTGFVVPRGDVEEIVKKIDLLMKDEALREEAGKEARKRVEEKFSLKAMTRQYESLYEECFNEIRNKH